MNIQWYPGHMTRTKREMVKNLSSVDVTAEVIDARIPRASRNRELDEIVKDKPRILVLNRVDQADDKLTAEWIDYYRSKGFTVLSCDAKTGAGTAKLLPAVRSVMAERLARLKERGQVGRSIRVMVIGVPNVGKSSFINRVVKKKAAKTEDRPGVTRAQTWIRLEGGDPPVDLLDTPGMLAPKIVHAEDGLHLAFTGAVRDDILDIETLSSHLIALLARRVPAALSARYKLTEEALSLPPYELLAAAARGRGFLMSGGLPDCERMAKILLDEYRGGKLGKITLELPGEGYHDVAL